MSPSNDTNTAPTQTTTFHRFLDLPTELKLQILHHIQTHARLRIRARTHSRGLPFELFAALASKELRTLSYDVYYRHNVFFLHEEIPFADVDPIHRVLLVPKPAVSQHIRHLTLQIDVFSWDVSDRDWGCLFGHDADATAIQWQRNFRALTFFKATVCPLVDLCWGPRLDDFKGSLSGMVVLLKAEEVKVKVTESPCGHRCKLERRCREDLEAVLREKVVRSQV